MRTWKWGKVGGADGGRRLRTVADLNPLGLEQPQLAPSQRPVLVHRFRRRVPGGQGNELHLFQAVAFGPLDHPGGLLAEVFGAAARRVVHHQLAQVIEGDVAGNFVDEFRVSLFREERALLSYGGTCNPKNNEYSNEPQLRAHIEPSCL